MSREPNPNQPDRCPSIDPYGALQCGRRIHDDDQCHIGGIAWTKGTPPVINDRAKALNDAADAWRDEGRDVVFNRNRDDLSPQQRVERWMRIRAEREATA